MPIIAKSQENKARRFSKSLLSLVLIILFVVFVRLRLLEIPLERDEGEYAYMGQLILQGVPPYSEAYNMKFPGTYLMYALIMAIFGQTVQGIHIGLMIVNCATILLVYLLTRKMIDDIPAAVAGGTYGVLSLSSSVYGFAAHATHFVVLPALGGTLLLLHAFEKEKLRLYFLSGTLLGISVVMKQPGIFFVLFGVTYIVYRHFPLAKDSESKTSLLSFPLVGNPSSRKDCGQANSRPDGAPAMTESNTGCGTTNAPLMRPAHSIRALFLKLSALSLGALLPLLITSLWLYLSGVFPRFWFWTFVYASRYGARVPLSEGFVGLKGSFLGVADDFYLVWICSALGFVAMFFHKGLKVNKSFILLFAFFSFLSICPGFYFRKHYFVTLLPAAAIMAGIFMDFLGSRAPVFFKTQLLQLIGAGIFIAAALVGIIQQKDYFFNESPVRLSGLIYSGNPFPESLVIARFIEARTTSNDRIAVLGSEPQIFFYANRRSATGYIYMYSLMETQEYALPMQREMIAEVEASKPKFLIDVRSGLSWLQHEDSETYIFGWLNSYIDNYNLVGVVDMLYPGLTIYKWYEDAKNYKIQSDSSLLIYERR